MKNIAISISFLFAACLDSDLSVTEEAGTLNKPVILDCTSTGDQRYNCTECASGGVNQCCAALARIGFGCALSCDGGGSGTTTKTGGKTCKLNIFQQ